MVSWGTAPAAGESPQPDVPTATAAAAPTNSRRPINIGGAYSPARILDRLESGLRDRSGGTGLAGAWIMHPPLHLNVWIVEPHDELRTMLHELAAVAPADAEVMTEDEF